VRHRLLCAFNGGNLTAIAAPFLGCAANVRYSFCFVQMLSKWARKSGYGNGMSISQRHVELASLTQQIFPAIRRHQPIDQLKRSPYSSIAQTRYLMSTIDKTTCAWHKTCRKDRFMRRFVPYLYRALFTLFAGTFLASLPAATMDAGGRKLIVTTTNLTVVFDGGSVVSLQNRISGEIYSHPRVTSEQPHLNLLQPAKESPIAGGWSLGNGTATFGLKTAEQTVLLRVHVDEPTGEIVTSLSGESQAPGVRGLLWPVVGVDGNVSVVVPARSGSMFNGRSLRRPVSLSYPSAWEAQMLVLAGTAGSLLIYSPDRNATFKTLHLDPGPAGTMNMALETEAVAPWRKCKNVPPLEWRMKAFAGDWRKPAAAYRQVMSGLGGSFATQHGASDSPELAWTHKIRSVVTLVTLDPQVLDRLAGLLAPSKTLIYVVDWRLGGYDVNYPDYTPRDGAETLIQHAHELGFRVMLHGNFYGVSPANPDYGVVRAFQIRSPDTLEPQGWLWDQPESTPQRFAYINPASAAFRQLLVRRLRTTLLALRPDAVHLDVSGVMFNDGSGLVEGMSSALGSLALHRELQSAFPNIGFGAEGMNELLAGSARFAQRWLTEYAPHPISTYLFGSDALLYGYLGQPEPDDPNFLAYIEKYERQGVLPTLKAASPADFDASQTGMQRLIRLIRLWQDREFEPDWTAEGSADTFHYRSAVNGAAAWIDTGSIVRLKAGSELIYERAHASNRIRTDSYVPGWPAFDRLMLYGLDPARQYWLERVARPILPAHAESLPSGVKLAPDTMVTGRYARFAFDPVKTTVYDFLDGFPVARKGVALAGTDSSLSRGATVSLTTMSCGGEARPVIFAHPPYQPPEGETFVEYTVEIPRQPHLTLEFEMGISDAARKTGTVTFAVAAGGTELFREQVMPGEWRPGRVSLERYRGATIRLRFLTTIEGQKDDGWDWAGWSRLLLISSGAGDSIDVPVSLAMGPLAAFRGEGELVAHTSTSVTVKNVPVPGSFLLFLQRGVAVSAGRDLLDLPPVIWHGVGGDLPQPGPVWRSGTIGAVTSGSVARARAMSAHPPDHGRTILAWTLRLPRTETLRLNWSAGISDGSRSTGVEFQVRINGGIVWRHRTHVPGWSSGGVDLGACMGSDVLVELVTDSLGDNSFDWAEWADLKLAMAVSGQRMVRKLLPIIGER
jgi:hypothetical protein